MTTRGSAAPLVTAIAATLCIGLSTIRCDDATDDPAAGGQDAGTDTDTGTDTGTDGLGGFGDPCETTEDCATDVCHEFGQLGWVCTYYCETDEDCPVGSQGQKCNQQGVCRP